MLNLVMGKSEAGLMEAAVVISGDALWEVVGVAVPARGDPRNTDAFPPSTPANLPMRNLSNSYQCG